MITETTLSQQQITYLSVYQVYLRQQFVGVRPVMAVNSGRLTRYVSNVNSCSGRGCGSHSGRRFGEGNNRGGQGQGQLLHANTFNRVNMTDTSCTFKSDEMNKLGPLGQRLLYDLQRNHNSGQGNSGHGQHGRGNQSGRTISLLECVEHLEASIAGSNSISEVTGTPNGIASITTGRGKTGRTGGTSS